MVIVILFIIKIMIFNIIQTKELFSQCGVETEQYPLDYNGLKIMYLIVL